MERAIRTSLVRLALTRAAPDEALAVARRGLDAALSKKVRPRRLWEHLTETLRQGLLASPPERRAALLAGAVEEAVPGFEGDRESLYSLYRRLVDLGTAPTSLEPAPTQFEVRAGAGDTLVVGPWTMEVGFELLYWIPFLRAKLAESGPGTDRITAVGRGIAPSWYEGIADNTVDILDHWTPETFRDRVEAQVRNGGLRKPFGMGDLERDLLTDILGSPPEDGTYELIAPPTLFARFRNVWGSRIAGPGVIEHLRFASVTPPPPPVGLPSEPFLTAKLYFSEAFPDTERNRAFLRDVLDGARSEMPVVLLGLPDRLDDHQSFRLDAPGLIDGTVFYGSKGNLEVQTAIVGASRGLISVYGGFTYLGGLLGKPGLALVDDASEVNPVHFAVEHAMLSALGAPGRILLPPGTGGGGVAGAFAVGVKE
ncbi:MAG: hypothetical protein K9H25_01380 [Rhodospirillum sp.]|nr:hypothetical protein [Rhodospirillum sp.]MCF8488097.1 hypothetical protein [Rhodospirillum sp.]MCF8501577.1 hypothetical protein [Rhodospirillum sp.]